MWDTKEFRSVDDYALAVDAHLHALAAAMGEGEGHRGTVWSREAYRVGTLEIVYRGERSSVSGEMRWVHCSVRAPLDVASYVELVA